MVHVGQKMRNVRAGERSVWRATREPTNGAYCEFDLHLDADAKVAAPHRHPQQKERFTVVTGQVELGPPLSVLAALGRRLGFLSHVEEPAGSAAS